MQNIVLDKRLSEILSHIKGDSFADIGCDHGKLAVKAILCGATQFAIATDISVLSLDKTIRLAEKFDLSDKIVCRVGDGLDVLKDNEVDTVVIAGLGGDEITKILQNAKMNKKEFRRFVLSPNTHSERVRQEAILQGFSFVRDYLILSEKKFYPIIVLENLNNNYCDCQNLNSLHINCNSNVNNKKNCDCHNQNDINKKCHISNAKKSQFESALYINNLTELQIEFGMEYATCACFKKWAESEMQRLSKLIEKTENNTQLILRLNKIKEAYENSESK